MQHTAPGYSRMATLKSNVNQTARRISQLKIARVFHKHWLATLVLALATLVTVIVVGQTTATAPSIPAISLSTDPLFAATGGDKPVIALALSVEFPTVGAQYVAAPGASTDATYSNINEYLGYYDAESCYSYNNAPTETPATGLTSPDYKRFDRSGPAVNRMCSDAFSGNFLNWSSSSAIDMLRLALSGGDRYIDSTSLTVLQRAVIPDGNPICMWNSSNFPAKQLLKSGGSSGIAYFGAVPTAMATTAGTNDIWVGNRLNRIYFRSGSASSGTCTDQSGYTLGGPTTAAIQKGPYTMPTNAPLPSDAVLLGGENRTYYYTGTKEVWFGAVSGGVNYWTVLPASGGIDCYWTGGGGPFGGIQDPIGGVAKKCYVRPYSGTWTPATSASALNSDGFFYSRVQVCNVSGTTLQDSRDYGLCKQYPNGNYKPTGSIQKYSDQLRLSAFGYLMDQADGGGYSQRFGGVLRAPTKYVGPKTYDDNGQDNTPSGGNPKTEWNASTGVFNANPDGDTTQTTPISGVINYLNKFGRTGPVAGRYKIYDPVGELYGEALRYLQGLAPTPEAVSSITSDMYDGFPAATTWADPYGGTRTNTADYSCLKSNIVVIGDVNTWDSKRLFTRTADLSSNLPNLNDWNTIAHNFESNIISTYTDGQGNSTRTTGNPNTPNTQLQVGANGYQGPLVASAYWARTHDIRGTNWTSGSGPNLQRLGLRVKSYFFNVNEYASSNNASYRQNQDQFFTAAKYGGFETDSANINNKPYNTFGNPFKRQDGTNDNAVWQDAANPGEASTFYLQSNARAVLNAFDSIFSRASTSARSIAGSAAASKNLMQAGSTVYQASFDTSDWSGDVLSLPISVSTTNTVSVATTPNWTASTRLSTLTAPATSRNIFVGRAGATSNPVASAFTWVAIDTALQTNLNKASSTSTADGLGQDRLNYLRGDQSKAGTPFRSRTKLLGDIVNSGIVYSGIPAARVGASSTYSGFYTANSTRTPAVFVGANDGMMHAFNATTGDELFAYIPSWMGTKLSALTNSNYNSNHQNYVDATPAVAEAQTGTAGTSADWKTVLVSGTGGGGSGVFALDVTDPTAFSASKVMWEFTRTDDADLGYVVGRPQIVKLQTSAPGAATATYKWFAMIASGVNNYVADPALANAFSTTGNPALFLLALDKPAGTAWTSTGATPNYYKISLPVNSTTSATNATGLINFRPTFGSSSEVSQVYMGDLHGNMWKLNFALHGSSEWILNKLSAYNKGTASLPNPYPLYIANTAAGAIQPISMAPSIVSGPVIGGINTAYVAFGTGKYLEPSDKTSTAQNSLYVVYDDGTTTKDSTPAGNSIVSGRGRLQAGTVNLTTGVVSVPAFKAGRAISDADTTKRSGWYVDFPASGERLINNMTVAGNNLILGSLIPAATGATGSCSAAGGSGNEYIVNVDTGNGTVRASTVGLLGEPLILDVGSATTYTTSTTTGRRIKTIVKQVIQQGSSGVSASTTSTSTIAAGRLSWRQINNYQDLKNAP